MIPAHFLSSVMKQIRVSRPHDSWTNGRGTSCNGKCLCYKTPAHDMIVSSTLVVFFVNFSSYFLTGFLGQSIWAVASLLSFN